MACDVNDGQHNEKQNTIISSSLFSPVHSKIRQRFRCRPPMEMRMTEREEHVAAALPGEARDLLMCVVGLVLVDVWM